MATVQEYIRSVRIALNMNQTDAGLSGISDEETLELDALIEKNIPEGIRFVIRNAPLELLTSGVIENAIDSSNCTILTNHINEARPISTATGTHIGIFRPTRDIGRMLAVYISDWERPVVDFITPEDPLYDKCYSKHNVKGTLERPIVAIATRSKTMGANDDGATRQVLELFRIPASFSGKAIYIPDAVISSSSISPNFTGTAYDLAVSYIAYLTALSLGDEGLAQRMLVKYNSIIGTTNQLV